MNQKVTDNNGIYDVAPAEYVLDEFTRGYSQCVSNNWHYAVYAQNPGVSVWQNEFNAGFVQGKVQGLKAIRAARNNTWRNFMVCSTPQDAISVDVPASVLAKVEDALVKNYAWLYDYVAANAADPRVEKIVRLMFRMAGIWAGVNYDKPRTDLQLADLAPASFKPEHMKLGLADAPVSFMDVYLINCQEDLFDGISADLGLDLTQPDPSGKGHRRRYDKPKPDHCTAFLKFMGDDEIIWTHNSWSPFWAQTCAVTYVIGDDFVTQNALCQGQFGSNTDFGFNGHGIGFNETTHVNFYDRPKLLGIFITWRSAAAEQFATSIDDFYAYITMDNTGTYLNGYMVVDAFRNEAALIDMSYSRFALFRLDGKNLKVSDSTGYEPTFLDYDHHLVGPSWILGINQPVYHKIGYELESMNKRPMRRVQLHNNLGWVADIEDAKRLITYTEDREPLSIYGRWDLGYGTTEFHFVCPDGSQDAKACSTSMIRQVLASLSKRPSLAGSKKSFWMKFGTPYVEGRPFVWSESRFAWLKGPMDDDFVPDRLDGHFNLVNMFME